jgi:hypothetical protein
MPALLQDAPALAAALAGLRGDVIKRETVVKIERSLLFI